MPDAAAINGNALTPPPVRVAVDGDAAEAAAPVEREAPADDALATDSDDGASSEDESDDDDADLDDTVDRQATDLDDADDDVTDDDGDGGSTDGETEDEAESDAGDLDGLDRVEEQEWETAHIAEEVAVHEAADEDASDSDVDSEGSSDEDDDNDDATENDDVNVPSVRAAGGSDDIEPVDHADDGTWEDMSSDGDAESANDTDVDASDSENATDLFGESLAAGVADAGVTAWAAPAAGEGADQEAVRRVQLGDYAPLSAASPFVVGDADETKA